MPMTTFTETMRGRIGPGRDAPGSAPLPWSEDLAHRRGTARRTDAGDPLVLRGLRLELRHPRDSADGFRGPITAGAVDFPGFSGRVVRGTAEILVPASGRRIMRYRIVAADEGGRRVHVHGVKYLVGGILHRWRDTTTLYVDVFEGRAEGADDGTADTGTIRERTPARTGIARVHVGDLFWQVLSIHGSTAPFVGRFLRRLL